MKVILIKNISELGNIDDVKEVADGYARNFLFPNHLAIQATAADLQKREQKKTKNVQQSMSNLRKQQSLAGQLDGMEVDISEKANEKGVLYAAVTAQKISGTLGKMGFEVKPEQLSMKPLKEIGSFPVILKLGHGLEVEVTVNINALK